MLNITKLKDQMKEISKEKISKKYFDKKGVLIKSTPSLALIDSIRPIKIL